MFAFCLGPAQDRSWAGPGPAIGQLQAGPGRAGLGPKLGELSAGWVGEWLGGGPRWAAGGEVEVRTVVI